MNAGERGKGGTVRLITVQETAAILSVSKVTVYKMMDDGELPYFPLGKRGRRVKLSDVEAMIERNLVGGPSR